MNIIDISGLVIKTNYDVKIADIENKYITTFDYNKFIKDIVSERIKRKKFLKKTDIADLVKTVI